ncbi:hypothetical protein [Sorangium sp. So ce1097]|uniref:hypothetical protein n=1 Tax=Sorangium sp. So ce1097 TaxID=3133330 RepID=UPI003F5E2B52
MSEGQMAMAMPSSAPRDEAVDPRASAFALRRGAEAGIAFGGGAHYCIGVALARLEGRIAIETLLDRFPDMELAGPASFASHPSIRKMTSLPVRLRPQRMRRPRARRRGPADIHRFPWAGATPPRIPGCHTRALETPARARHEIITQQESTHAHNHLFTHRPPRCRRAHRLFPL